MANPLNVNPNIPQGTQADAMAGSGAMIVSGLDKELKTKPDNIIINDPKINLKQLEEYIQKLSHTSEVEKTQKWKHQKGKQQKEKAGERPRRRIRWIREEVEPFSWKEKLEPTKNFLLDFFYTLEQNVLHGLLKFALQPGLDELIKLADEMKINLGALKLEKFNITHSGKIILSSELSPIERKFLLLRDELKMLEIGDIVEEDWIKLIIIKLRKRSVRKAFIEIGANQEVINSIKDQAKHIAYLKILHELKSFHLKRVFCGAKKDFDYYSKLISRLTHKIRKIDISGDEANLDWIKGQLNKMALETAEYKLKVLHSMQKLNFEKSRQKDIHWLETTIRHLKHA